jgi:hypothetical protein
MELETTNPDAPEVETEVQDNLPTDDIETDDQQPDDEEEEIELDDGLKLKLPKSDAEKLRLAAMRQADYTRKTQELAEARKAFDAERQSLSQADEQELTARANIALIDRQLAQYAQVNWQQAFDADPFEAQKAFAQYQLLQQGKSQTQSFLERTSRERTERQQQETARRLQEGAAELQRDIPDWSPALSAKLQDFGAKTFGLTKDDFDRIDDPRAVKLLYWAQRGFEADTAAKKAKSIERQQEVTPAASAPKKGGTPPAGLDDRLSTDEWLRRRNAQLAKRGKAGIV